MPGPCFRELTFKALAGSDNSDRDDRALSLSSDLERTLVEFEKLPLILGSIAPSLRVDEHRDALVYGVDCRQD